MTKPSLHAQAAAIDVAVRYTGRSPPKMRPGEADMLVRGLKAARQTLFKLQSWRDRLPTEAISVSAPRLQRLARQIHALGERPLYECLLELERGADLLPTLERYGRLAPFATFIAENGGRDLPKLRVAVR
jgi:hypothetical protein